MAKEVEAVGMAIWKKILIISLVVILVIGLVLGAFFAGKYYFEGEEEVDPILNDLEEVVEVGEEDEEERVEAEEEDEEEEEVSSGSSGSSSGGSSSTGGSSGSTSSNETDSGEEDEEVVESCDTDGGYDVWTKGVCSDLEDPNQEDYCLDGNFNPTLVEFLCGEEGGCSSEPYDCNEDDAFCFEGICRLYTYDGDGDGCPDGDEFEWATDYEDENDAPCLDSDGGHDVWTKGTLTDADGESVDNCPGGPFTATLEENWCDDCFAWGESYNCEFDDAFCYDGACVTYTQDTDGDGFTDFEEYSMDEGDINDPSLPGCVNSDENLGDMIQELIVIGTCRDNAGADEMDYCDGGQVYEWYCHDDTNTCDTIAFVCGEFFGPYVCSGGVCVEELIP